MSVTISKLTQRLAMISKSSIDSSSGADSNPYRMVEFWGSRIGSCLQPLIVCQIRQLKDLDIPSEKVYSFSNSQTIQSVVVNFQHNPSLLELAMLTRHSKVLKVKPLRDFSSPPEAFSFRG